jgi:hypothetical protein
MKKIFAVLSLLFAAQSAFAGSLSYEDKGSCAIVEKDLNQNGISYSVNKYLSPQAQFRILAQCNTPGGILPTCLIMGQENQKYVFGTSYSIYDFNHDRTSSTFRYVRDLVSINDAKKYRPNTPLHVEENEMGLKVYTIEKELYNNLNPFNTKWNLTLIFWNKQTGALNTVAKTINAKGFMTPHLEAFFHGQPLPQTDTYCTPY